MSDHYSQDEMDWLRGEYRKETDLKRLDALHFKMEMEARKPHPCHCDCVNCVAEFENAREGRS